MQKKKEENKILILPVKKRVELPETGPLGTVFCLDIFETLFFSIWYHKSGFIPFWLEVSDGDKVFERLPLRIERCQTDVALFCQFHEYWKNLPATSIRLFSSVLPKHIQEPFLAAWEWEAVNGPKSIFDIKTDVESMGISKWAELSSCKEE